MKRILLALALLIIPASAWAQCNGVFQTGTVCGVGAAEAARPPHQISLGSTIALQVGTTSITGGTSLGILYNNVGVLGNTNSVTGALLNTATPTATPSFTRTPVVGVPGTATGTLGFGGVTSGTATITPQATAGSPTLTLPNTSGTFAVGASSPIVLNSTTGNLTCPTCATSSGGGAITGTAPINVTAAGVVSLQGGDGTVATGVGGTGSAFTATPALGVAGSSNGTLTFNNTTSGSVTVSPVAGALGSRTISLPAASGTFAVSASSPITLSAAGDIGLSTPLALNFGGTNANLTASNGGIFWSNATQAQILAGTATANQVLLSGSTATPAWSTATYPPTTAAGTVLGSSSANVIAGTAQPTLGANGGTGGQITLNGSTSGSSTVKVNSVAGASTNFQLPSSNGTSGQVLSTDGSGNTSWVSASGSGTVTSITQGGITTLSSSPCTSSCTIGTNATITPQGRLTLTSGTPVMTATVTGGTVLYYTMYVGNLVPIFNGTASWAPTTFTELSITLGANWTTNTNYDVYVGLDSSTLRLCTGAAWASGTARTETITRTNGIYLNNASMTCRYGNANTFTCSALTCTYVGTIRTTAAGQIDYIFGASASGGTASVLNVWNAFNRVDTPTVVTDSGASYTYTSATIRQARASAGNQVSFVRGLDEDSIQYSYQAYCVTAAAAGSLSWGVGFDSTSAFSRQFNTGSVPTANAIRISGSNVGNWLPGVGTHFISANEQGDGSNANSFDFNSTNAFMVTVRN